MQTVMPSLAAFDRPHLPPADALSSRVTAALLTAALGALTVLLAMQKTFWMVTDYQTPPEIVTMLMREAPHKQVKPPPPPFVTLLYRMRAEKPAPPVFTVAAETLSAPAPLQATAAQSSPLEGGVMTATGTGPQSISANGTNGNGKGLSACWDAVWGQAVHDRIALFFYYPAVARLQHLTGTVMVHMVVRRSGRLDMVDIASSSGHFSLDAAAKDMVRKAQPLPAIPDRMHADRIDAEMAISFGAAGNFPPTPGSCD